jgi:hypothetical protein
MVEKKKLNFFVKNIVNYLTKQKKDIILHSNSATNILKCVSEEGLRINKGVYQSGQMGQTVNLLAYAYGGSNPSAPTI